MAPGLGAVVFLTAAIIVVVGTGFFLVHRVMTKPDAHIGTRLPKDDPAGPAHQTDRHRDPSSGRSPDRSPGRSRDGEDAGGRGHLGEGR